MNAVSKLHKNTVLLVGAGNIGSRHLQGLSKCNIPLNIIVSDKNERSLANAKKRYGEISKNTEHEVTYVKNLHNIKEKIDLCLVATNSDIREHIISEIHRKYKVRYWILEKIVAQSVEQLESIEKIVSSADGCWVNTPRRSICWHKKIKEELQKSNEWVVNVRGNNWGLVCNSIHFLDLIEWWAEETLHSVEVDEISTWIHSKRVGFWDLKGKLIATYSKGSVLTLTDQFKLEEGFEIEIDININQKQWILNEIKGIFKGPNDLSIPGKVDLQSETTGLIVEKILKEGYCLLPTITMSSKLHRILLNGLLTSWQDKFGNNSKILAIT